MTVLQIFDKVNLFAPVEQRDFFSHLNASIAEVAALHGDSPGLVFHGNLTSADLVPIDTLSGEEKIPLLPLYHDALADNILYLCGRDAALKSEFLRKTDEAFRQYWSINAKGRKIRRKGGWQLV